MWLEAAGEASGVCGFGTVSCLGCQERSVLRTIPVASWRPTEAHHSSWWLTAVRVWHREEVECGGYHEAVRGRGAVWGFSPHLDKLAPWWAAKQVEKEPTLHVEESNSLSQKEECERGYRSAHAHTIIPMGPPSSHSRFERQSGK